MTLSHEISIKEKRLSYQPNLVSYPDVDQSFNLYDAGKKDVFFFPDQRLNAAYNAIERHALGERKNKVALYHLDSDLKETSFTFYELNRLANQFGNYLRRVGVGGGQRVFFFLPRTPSLFYGFLGTLKIGAIAGTMFSAFGSDAIVDRLGDSGAAVLVTNRELGKRVAPVRQRLTSLKTILYVEDLEEALANESAELSAVPLRPDDPAFMLYTSGTTGKPKGVVHAHRAIIHEHLTAKWVLDLKEHDIYWCTADPGWVTGIAYEILSPLSLGVSTVIYEGRFDPEIWYRIIEKQKVSVWYSAPTAIRMLEAAGDDLVKRSDLSTLRHLASVGEPLNPEPLLWAWKTYGLPFHDNWWQTETGGILVANFPCLPIRPGSMGKPVPGITAAIVDDEGKEVPPMQEGNLAIKKGWDSMMKEIWNNQEKYKSYFIGEWYISGDRAYRDQDGYFWFIGRADDVIKTSGERVGPFEVESAIVSFPGVVESGVIGKPDPLRGEIIKAFVVLKRSMESRLAGGRAGVRSKEDQEKLKEQIVDHVKKHLAGHAYPREIEFVDSLPKTRSGKIMRRMLRAKELGLPIGDTSTLEEY